MRDTPALLGVLVSFLPLTSCLLADEPLHAEFQTPTRDHRPETWFHLIGGNVSKAGLTKDLEAISQAGMQGIQLFHGSGRAWPGVSPQIQTLSESWDDMIRHVADETKRLDLRFTMQNCPGWAMSGGPWITPDKAMRHVIASTQHLQGGQAVSIALVRPEPSEEAWRDYRDITVLGFPTPDGDGDEVPVPTKILSNLKRAKWMDLLAGKKNASVVVPPAKRANWLELSFERPVTLRSIELPPIELLMKRRNFDPDTRIHIQIPEGSSRKTLTSHVVPRGNWQDRLPEFPLVLAVADASSKTYRIVFDNKHPLEISRLKLSSTARPQDWRGQAGFALRSMERGVSLAQNPAAWVRRDSVVDLTDRLDSSGRLQWDAPPGDWTIVRFGHVNTGAKNKPAPPEATGFECDKLSAAGAEQHFDGYIGRLTNAGGPADGGRLQGMLIDSWECYTQTWTPGMEREFEARRGYPLRKWMPALAGWVVDDPLSTERFLRDWRATISDLLVEKYFGRLAELARDRGMKLSFETAIGDVSPGDILEYQGKADIPMCEIWQRNDPHFGGYETKPVYPTTSAAHIYGKPRVAAETFTAAPFAWSDHPFALKHFADRHFALGVSHVVTHTYTHNPLDQVPGTSFGGKIGSPFLRGQTWWRHMPEFTTYLARCGQMLEQGNPVADVLWYLGDDLDHKPRQDAPFPDGYKFDYLNADALINRFQIKDGRLTIPEGTSWSVIWLPRENCRRLTPATLSKLKELIYSGASVIGEAPDMNPSLSGGAKADEEFTKLVHELWGESPGPSGDRSLGKGRLVWGSGLVDQLRNLKIAPDVTGTGSASWFHRRDGLTDIYFVTAARSGPLAANLRFRAIGTPELWDPLTGKTKAIACFHQDSQFTTIPLDLPAAGSVFVVFKPGPAANPITKIYRNGTPWLDATDLALVDQSAPYPHLGLTLNMELQPWIAPAPPTGEFLDHNQQLLVWNDGNYQITRADGTTSQLTVSGTRRMTLDKGWSLSFPAGWDAPETLDIDKLVPWTELKDKAARHFSGTATYRCEWGFEVLKPNERAMIDLGRVSDIAEIRVNGSKVTTLWATPFRAEITNLLKPGTNLIEIVVTNTWQNRLIFDEGLPKAKRKTWTYNAPAADTPLTLSGLSGPVQVLIGNVHKLPLP